MKVTHLLILNESICKDITLLVHSLENEHNYLNSSQTNNVHYKYAVTGRMNG